MLRFFVLSLVIVTLVLVEGRRTHRKDVPIHNHKISTNTKPKENPPREVAFHKEATMIHQVSNRHRRALPEPPSPKAPQDSRPCVLHSFRYGCVCRYGDFKCPYPPEYPLL